MNKLQKLVCASTVAMSLFGIARPSFAQTYATGTPLQFIQQGSSQVQVPSQGQNEYSYFREPGFPMTRMMWGWPGYGYDNEYGYGFGTRYHWGVGMMAVAAFFWILVTALIIGLLRRVFGWRRRGYHHAGLALDILSERYARGEIDKAEYEARKKDILS